MKVYDLILFNDEIEILKARLSYLYEKFDYFIITEFNQTFSGKEKVYNFENHFEEFSEFKNKLIYQKLKFEYVAHRINFKEKYFTDFTKSYAHKHSGRPPKVLHKSLKNEILQRDSCIDILLKMINDDDFIFISDVDEIPNKKIIDSIGNLSKSKSYILEQDWRQFFINYRVQENWYGTVITNKKMLEKSSIDLMRCSTSKKENVIHEIINDGGWHFSYMGGSKAIRKKLNDLSYQGLKAEFTKFLSSISEAFIKMRLDRGEDLLNQGRKFKKVEKETFEINNFTREFLNGNLMKNNNSN